MTADLPCDCCGGKRPTMRIRLQRVEPEMPPPSWINACEACLIGARVIVELPAAEDA